MSADKYPSIFSRQIDYCLLRNHTVFLVKFGIKVASFSRSCGAASVGVLQDNFVLSTGLIMLIGHRKEIRKLTFRALALRRSEWNCTRRSEAHSRLIPN